MVIVWLAIVTKASADFCCLLANLTCLSVEIQLSECIQSVTMVGAVYCPQYTEKQLGTTKVDKGEIYLTVTAKHATIADMQPNSIRDLKGVCVGNPSYCRVLIKISSPANTVAAKAAGLSGNLLLNCSKTRSEGEGGRRREERVMGAT